MNPYVSIAADALWLILLISMPPLLASLIVGLVISLLQAMTQVQEQTLTFVPKIIVTMLALIITAGWMLVSLREFTERVFDMILKVGAAT